MYDELRALSLGSADAGSRTAVPLACREAAGGITPQRWMTTVA